MRMDEKDGILTVHHHVGAKYGKYSKLLFQTFKKLELLKRTKKWKPNWEYDGKSFNFNCMEQHPFEMLPSLMRLYFYHF